MLALVGYGVGNIRSVMNALDAAGVAYFLADQPARLADADRFILPGVGAFRTAMERLVELGFAEALQREVIEQGKPVLGICVGMQMLATTGTEFGEYPGLGWIPGRVEIIGGGRPNLRLPQIGWNTLEPRRDCKLLADLGPEPSCYFVHSYHFVPDDPDTVVATCDYGGPVTAVVACNHIYGAQFHPEKSQHPGLKILANFAHIRC